MANSRPLIVSGGLELREAFHGLLLDGSCEKR